MKFVKRSLALAGAALIVGSLALMTGCNKKIPVQENVPFKFPYPEHIELTWYYGYNDTYFDGAFTAIEDHPFLKRLEEKTNVHMIYKVPTATSLEGGRDEIQTMLAADDMTDLVTQAFFGLDLAGSTLDSVIDEEIYLPLNEYIDIQMPNFKALCQEYAEIERSITTTQGNIVYLPKISALDIAASVNGTQRQTSGMLIRKDFLDEIQFVSEDGVSGVPITIADWERCLTEFQVKLNVATPLAIGIQKYAASMGQDVFITCYHSRYEWYLDENGKVAYGTIGEGVRKYCEMMGRWVNNGLAVPVDADATLKTSNDLGAWVGSADDIMTLKNLSNNPTYELVACPDPVVNVGDKVVCRGKDYPIGSSDANQVYLAFTCSQPAIAAKWLDQFYTVDAFYECSYGVENEDYTKNADGTVTFTDKIKNASDPTGGTNGMRYGIAQNAFGDGMWHDGNVIANYVYSPEAIAACDVWSQATAEYSFPTSVLSFEQEEADALKQQGNFWGSQMNYLVGYSRGGDMSTWDEFIASMKDAGIDEKIEIYQAAYDRYLAS